MAQRSQAKTTNKGNGSTGDSISLTPEQREMAIRAAASILAERTSFADKAGLSFFDTSTGVYKRSLFTAGGYNTKLTTDFYRARYERGGIAERIVEAYPRATWAGGASIVEDPDPGIETEFEKAVIALFDRLDVWARLLRADILSGLGRYSVLLIGADGELDQEFPRLNGPDGVISLTPRAEDKATIQDNELVTDSNDPRFGLPEFYRLNLGGTNTSVKTHWTRVLHITEGTLEDDVYGKPRLRAVWNLLDDLDKLVTGGSEAAWIRMQPGMQMDLDPTAQLTSAEQSAIEDEVDDYLHKLRRVIRTRGMKLNLLSSTVAGFGPNVDSVLQLISATTGIPHRILTGSERGELASSQDRNNWNDRGTERRREFAIPLVGQFINRLIDHGGLPKPKEYEAVWPEIDELDETEKAEVAGRLANANKAQFDAGGGLILTANEIRDNVLGLGPLEEIDDGGEDDGEQQTTSARKRLKAAKLRLAPKRPKSVFISAEFDLTDTPPDEPEWKAVHRAADAHRDALARVFLGAWAEASEAIDAGTIEQALSQNDTQGAERIVLSALEDADSRLASILPDRILAVLVDGGLSALRSVRARGSWIRAASAADVPLRAAQFHADFDATNPRATEWAARESSDQISKIAPETVLAMRELIAEGFRGGIPPRKLAQQIRQWVGLRKDQIDAVRNLIAEMEAAEAGALITRVPPREGLREIAGFRVRVPTGGATEEWMEAQSARYARMQLNLRARTIARTECLPPETQINTAVVGAVYRRPYTGQIAEVRTRDGRQFRATPNHPMLTNRGWVGAGSLQEGDYLVYDSREQHVSAACDGHIETPPPSIAEVFDAASYVGLLEQRRTAEADFHGDGRQGQVDVAHPLRPLTIGSFAALYKPVVEKILAPADQARACFCGLCGHLLPIDESPCFCLAPELYTRLAEAMSYRAVVDAKALGYRGDRLAGLIAGGDLANRQIMVVGRSPAATEESLACVGERPDVAARRAHNFGDGRAIAFASRGDPGGAQAGLVQLFDSPIVESVAQARSLRSGPHRVPSRRHPFSDAVTVGADDRGDLSGGQAGEIKLDRVLSVRLREWSGHVYNLSTPFGYFAAAGSLYTGNTLHSANQGQKELWFQARDRGDLQADQKRVLITTPDARRRDAHAAAHGQIRGLDEPFDMGDGTTEPGQAPNCRCGQGLATPEDIERAAA